MDTHAYLMQRCVPSEVLGQVVPATNAAIRGDSRLRATPTRAAMASTVLTARVVFACLVRDAEAYLERNLLSIVDLGRSFAEFKLLYVENDSTDGTRDILARLSLSVRPAGTVRFTSGDVNLVATHVRLNRSHDNRAVFVPEHGLDPYVDLSLLGAELQANIKVCVGG